MDKIISIYKTNDTTQADLIKAHLESNGINCFLRSDDAGGALPHLTFINGISVMIKEQDRDAALELIHTCKKQ